MALAIDSSKSHARRLSRAPQRTPFGETRPLGSMDCLVKAPFETGASLPHKQENRSRCIHLNRPTPNLIALQAFKQRFEVAFAKAFVGY